jgi:YHS domain-containing protein
MLRILLGLLLAYLAARAVARLIAGIVQGASGASNPKQPPPVGLVRDPVCGTYVVPSNALTAGSGRHARFFCSEGCRQAWIHR